MCALFTLRTLGTFGTLGTIGTCGTQGTLTSPSASPAAPPPLPSRSVALAWLAAGRHEAFDRSGRRRRGRGMILFVAAVGAAHRFGPVLHDAFERPHAALAEIKAARHRLQLHAQVLDLDPHARRFKDEIVQHLVIQGVPLGALDLAVQVPLEQLDVEMRLRVQHLVQGVRVEQQLQERVQQLSGEADEAAVRGKQRLIVEGVRRLRLRRMRVRGERRPALAELLQEIGPQVLRIEKLLEPHRGELADLILGIVGAALLEDALADLFHDLLDVDRFGPDGEITHRVTSRRVRPACAAGGWQTPALP